MKLKRFGFFGSMPKEKAIALLESLRANSPQSNGQRILAYLRGGQQLLADAGVVGDLLDKKKGMIGAPHVFSDGEWLWTADAIYYVENYHIEVPAEFIQRMEKQGWHCPAVENPQQLVMSEWQT